MTDSLTKRTFFSWTSSVSTTHMWLIGLGTGCFILVLLTAIFAGIVLTDQKGDTFTNVQTLSAGDTTCGPVPSVCYAQQLVTLQGGETTCNEYPLPAGTPCSDACVSSGTCTGPAPFDDRNGRAYCNATNYTYCKGACATFLDCDPLIPSFVPGLSEGVGDVCWGGSCLFTIDWQDDGPNVVDIVVFDGLETCELDYLWFGTGDRALRCSVILSNYPNQTQRDCLEWMAIDDPCDEIFTCLYQYRCARTYNFGSAGEVSITESPLNGGPPNIINVTMTKTQVLVTTGGTRIVNRAHKIGGMKRDLSKLQEIEVINEMKTQGAIVIDIPPSLAHRYKDVTTLKQAKNVLYGRDSKTR